MRRLFLALTLLATTTALAEEEDRLTPIDLPRSPLKTELVDALDQAIEAAGAEAGANLYRNRARQLAYGGQWKEAAADLRRAIDRLGPGHLNIYQQTAAALLLGDDRMNYEQLVEEFLEAQKENAQKFSQEKRAKLCVLPQAPIGSQEDVEAWIADAVANSDTEDWAPYFPATQALVYYRYEKYDEALKAVTETDRRHAIRGGRNQLLYARVRLTEAMCHAKTGDLDKALAAFTKADAILRSGLANPDLVLKNENWHDWMFGKLMHDEACDILKQARAKLDAKIEEEGPKH